MTKKTFSEKEYAKMSPYEKLEHLVNTLSANNDLLWDLPQKGVRAEQALRDLHAMVMSYDVDTVIDCHEIIANDGNPERYNEFRKKYKLTNWKTSQEAMSIYRAHHKKVR